MPNHNATASGWLISVSRVSTVMMPLLLAPRRRSVRRARVYGHRSGTDPR